MNKTPRILDVVNNDFCIGCGLCVYACPSKALKMEWNQYGFLIPKLSGNCDLNGDCIKVCPFNPFPEDEVKTENEIANYFLTKTQQFHPSIGRYNAIYAGYSKEFRLTSSSGGMGTYIFTELIESGIVDYVLSVKESQKQNSHYEYAISSSKEELLQASKTKYYPVTLAEVMSQIKSLDGNVAIVGVPCFIKSIRLAQYKEKYLQDKIVFLVGIICGGVKSSFFNDYLCSKVGVIPENSFNPQFRVKNHNGDANDYSFSCYDKETNRESFLKMRSVGDMWGTGMFKSNACDFCDDVAAELPDISLGDAWLKPYIRDGKGNNVLITRSKVSENIIRKGIKSGKLHLAEITPQDFINSQRGNYNHKHKGLPYRVKVERKKKGVVPIKRFGTHKVPIEFKVVQMFRMQTRKKSLHIWNELRNAYQFEKKMSSILSKLRLATRVYHLRQKIERQIK